MATYLLSREDPARETGVLKTCVVKFTVLKTGVVQFTVLKTGLVKSACIKAD
jgi:hypothetical protein